METGFGCTAQREQGQAQWDLPEWRVGTPGRVNLEDFLKEMAPDAASPKHLGHWIETQHSRLL